MAPPAPPLFTSSPKTVTGREQEYYIFVNTDESWSAETDKSWVTLDQTSGMSSGVITVSLAANPSATERTAKITINGIEQQLTQAEVIDANVTLTLVDDEIEIEFSGILQWSPDLVTWEDVELQPVKPYRFAPSTTARMFFRAREQ
ncbi:BACON domain-containing protein [bacterium]|nr:BACON domain-containing protein [Akkermansiaceae bacterium]MDA7901098.1 BACON domain-containing protein [bacterium]MDA7517423.1 BACON domain-containing protein [Akkermansiaceae bacterium]MDA7537768.1 BACON domain-containing protein [Akkermansiaceae bacterium]MDB0055685.1 BACON domain-containing protein [Akkermansiaceae bacterium]